MPEVFIDGESIQFDGPSPASLESLLAVVEQALGAAGRVLAGVSIDGAPCDARVPVEAFASASRIDVISLLIADAIAQVASSCGQTAATLRGESERLACDILRSSWSDLAPAIVAQSERYGALLQELGNLASHETIGPMASAFADALNRWMDAVAAHDAANLCLCLDSEIIPLLARVEACAAALGEGRTP